MVAVLFVTAAPADSLAGPVLDYIREYDLNNYALGLAVSNSQNPYLGASGSTIAYPYLTSFTHSAFTRNWLLIRGENVGLRFVTDRQWEFGLIGRVQTLGPGTDASSELDGIEDKSWALEAGPLIGWRGSPVHLQFRSYWEVPNRHSGTTSELEFSLPLQYRRGFFVPAVKLTHMSSGYTDYYFSVSESESTLSRPQYETGSATNVWAGFSLGYELSPRWLLKTSLGVEYLDDAIAASPIVQRDKQLSATVGLAYNADVFTPRDHATLRRDTVVEFRLGALSSAIDSSVQRNAAAGQALQAVDIEDVLGAADQRTTTEADVRIRAGFFHRFQISHLRTRRSATTTLERDLVLGDRTFGGGSEIATDVESLQTRFSYAYSLMRDGQKELSLKAGISHVRFSANLNEVGTPQEERLQIDTPLPAFGALGSLTLGNDWQLGADLDLVVIDLDRYSGYMGFLGVDLERRFGDHFGAGFGYSFSGVWLTSKDANTGGEIDLRYHGPKVYAAFAF
jgi:outer membrane scaffolding protein for murein synthesis (MipA/OmpV family)